MAEWWRPLAALLREADRYEVTADLARKLYLATASAAARVFGAIDEVDCVYLTGSLTRPEVLRPGVSDIDLIVSAQIASSAAERRLRRKLRRAHRFMQTVAPAFTSLDYFETRDLDYLRHFGNAWLMDLDRRWRALAGRDALNPTPPVREPRERELMHLSRCFKRWMKSSSVIASAPGSERTERARRLLGDVLAGRLDVERLLPLPNLLQLTPTSDLPTLCRIRDGVEPTDEHCFVAALEVLDDWARRRTAEWSDSFRLSSPAEPIAFPTEVRHVARRLARDVGATCLVVPRGSALGGGVMLAVAPGPIADLLPRLRRTLEKSRPFREPVGWVPWPVVLTPALYRALALAPPEPFVAAAVQGGATWLEGVLDPPPAPTHEDSRALLLARSVNHFVRRLERVSRTPEAFAREQAFERDWLRGALGQALDRETFALRARATHATDDLSVLRDWIAVQRARLENELQDRKTAQRFTASSGRL